MPPKTIQGTHDLAEKIKKRRQELKLTIEEAAARAGVGVKTWCRYEAGESIRQDKCRGVCKALNWISFPSGEETDNFISLVNEHKQNKTWPVFIEREFGPISALSFAAGSELFLDHLDDDLVGLSSMPAHSHIGQLEYSMLADALPPQYRMNYTYDFLYRMKCVLLRLRKKAIHDSGFAAHSVMEELLVYLCNEEGKAFVELCTGLDLNGEQAKNDRLDEWPFELFDDMDIVTWLYSDFYLTDDHNYSFCHWFDQQFYIQ